MKAIWCCHPESPDFLEVEHLMPLVTEYHLDRKSLAVERTIAKGQGARKCTFRDFTTKGHISSATQTDSKNNCQYG